MRGSAIQTPADFVVQFSRVVTSSLDATTQALQYSVPGIGEMDQADGGTIDNDPNVGEGTDDAEVFGAMGIVGRPLPQETIDGQDFHMEVVCIRESDGLIPIAVRDLRMKMPGGGPNEGTVALVGYGGGFLSHSAVDSGANGTISVLYCPYNFDSSGVAQKAHSIILDPTAGNESIMIVHADGMAITMSGEENKALLLKNAAGDATLRLDDEGITLTAVSIVLSGGVIIGDPLTAVPLLPGVLSPPSTLLFVSP